VRLARWSPGRTQRALEDAPLSAATDRRHRLPARRLVRLGQTGMAAPRGLQPGCRDGSHAQAAAGSCPLCRSASVRLQMELLESLMFVLPGVPVGQGGSDHGAEVLAFIQQGGLKGRGRTVLESLFAQDVQDTGAFDGTEGAFLPRVYAAIHRDSVLMIVFGGAFALLPASFTREALGTRLSPELLLRHSAVLPAPAWLTTHNRLPPGALP
jgi:hypothetical protein